MAGNKTANNGAVSNAAPKTGARYEAKGKTGPLAAGQVVEVEATTDNGVIVTYYEPVSFASEGGIGIKNTPRTVRLTPAQFAKLAKTNRSVIDGDTSTQPVKA